MRSSIPPRLQQLSLLQDAVDGGTATGSTGTIVWTPLLDAAACQDIERVKVCTNLVAFHYNGRDRSICLTKAQTSKREVEVD